MFSNKLNVFTDIDICDISLNISFNSTKTMTYLHTHT